MMAVVFYLLSLAAFFAAVLMAAAGLRKDADSVDCWLAVILSICAFGLAALAGRM